MILNRKHLDEIQYARAFAILGVLAVHSSSTGAVGVEAGTWIHYFYNFLYAAGKLGTPTFIFLSSFVLFYTYYYRPLTGKLIKTFYLKRLLYILLPYFVFSLIYFLNQTYHSIGFNDISFLVGDFFNKVLTGKAHSHLYFVFISVQFYLMFPFLLYLFKKVEFVRKYAIFIGIFIQWAWVIANSNYFQITMKGSISLSYMMYFFLGAFLGVYYEQVIVWVKDWRKSTIWIAVILFGYGFMVNFYTGIIYLTRIDQSLFSSRIIEFAWSTHAMFAAVVIFLAAHLTKVKFSERVKNVLTELGTVSFGIYLIHPLVLFYFRMWLPSGEPLIFHGWQILSLFVSLFGSWAIVRLSYNYLSYSWIIFGKDSRQSKLPTEKWNDANYSKRYKKLS